MDVVVKGETVMMLDKKRGSMMSLEMPPVGKKLLPTRAHASALERQVLGGLNSDKLSDLSEVLFTLNGHKYGPIPGFYVVVCTKPNEEWCVGQLSADRAQPLILFEEMRYGSAEEAQATAAELMEKAAGR